MDFLINGYRVPPPVTGIQQHTIDSTHVLYTWQCTTNLAGIPPSDRYAVEVIDSLANQYLILPDTIQTTCFGKRHF